MMKYETIFGKLPVIITSAVSAVLVYPESDTAAQQVQMFLFLGGPGGESNSPPSAVFSPLGSITQPQDPQCCCLHISNSADRLLHQTAAIICENKNDVSGFS